MSEDINEFNKILADLQNLHVEITNKDKNFTVLNSLPDS